MPVPLNITLSPGAPYVSLFGGYGANSWNEVFSSGSFGNWSEWTAIADGPSAVPLPPSWAPGASLIFNGSSIAVYGTMQWEGEGYNITVTPNIPTSGVIERWPGCSPITVCLSEPGVLWQTNNLENVVHNFSISTNYNLGINASIRGPTLSLTHIDITTSIPGDVASSQISNQSIPTSEFVLTSEDQWKRAKNGSLYTTCMGCVLSVNFTGTALLLSTAQSTEGFSPYLATIDGPAPDIEGDSSTMIGVVRQGKQDDGEVMCLATGLEDINHTLNIRTTGGFAVSAAYTFRAGSSVDAEGPVSAVSSSTAASATSASLSGSSTEVSSRYSRSVGLFMLLMLIPLLY